MRRRASRVLAAAACATVCVGLLVTAPLAVAAGGNAVINDCESNGALSHQYTPAQLHQALRVMPANVKQYTNCYDVIQQALANKSRTGSGGGGSGGSFLPTPVIVILVVLILAAVTFGALAIRRRRGSGDGRGGPDVPADRESP